MRRSMPIFLIALAILSLLGAISFGGCGRPDGQKKGAGCITDDSTSQPPTSTIESPTKYNFFIENSGSMAGYFSGNRSSDLETIIQDYYDRIVSENNVDGDTITLNYINTKKVNFGGDIKSYLTASKTNCTEKYTKIDDILSMAMENAKNDMVNIVISDYCFESDNGNYETAQSTIKSIFAQQLNNNSNMSVAILKYEAGFKGKYYPGGIACNQNMPVYFWIFGDANKVRKVLALSVKKQPLNRLLLQTSMTPEYSLNASNKRAIDNKNIIVKHLNKERHEDAYKFEVIVDLNKSILHEQDLKTIRNYSLNSSSASNYTIESINNEGDNYTFVIKTNKPSPGSLNIKYDLDLPQWVEDSNFEGSGLPKTGTTSGIKYLIGGVYDAYKTKADSSYFNISINLK